MKSGLWRLLISWPSWACPKHGSKMMLQCSLARKGHFTTWSAKALCWCCNELQSCAPSSTYASSAIIVADESGLASYRDYFNYHSGWVWSDVIQRPQFMCRTLISVVQIHRDGTLTLEHKDSYRSLIFLVCQCLWPALGGGMHPES